MLRSTVTYVDKLFLINNIFDHLGQMKTLRKLLEEVYWHTICHDVWEYCKACTTCHQLKPQIQKLSAPLQTAPVVEPAFMLGLNLMEPFPKSPCLNEHLLVVVNYYSNWVELFPLRSTETPAIAYIMVKDIFTQWETPAYLVSDRGYQFTLQLFNEI